MTSNDIGHAAVISLVVEGTLAVAIFAVCIMWWVALP